MQECGVLDEEPPIEAARAPVVASSAPAVAAAAICIAAYVAFASARIDAPFMDDETWEFYASKSLLEDGSARTVTGEPNVFHPHGYYHVLALAFRAFGVHESGARAVGVLATVLTFLLLLRMLRRLGATLDAGTVLLTGTLYLLAPAVVQGSLIITADTALHHLAITALVLCMVERWPLRAGDWWLLAALFAGCLWIKITTPCLVMGGLVLTLLIRRKWKPACAATLISGFGGVLIFAATWTLYCRAIGADAWVVADYILKTAQSRAASVSLSAKLVWLARQSVTIALWIGLPVLVLMGYALLRLPKSGVDLAPDGSPQRPPQLALLLVIGCVLFAVYTWIAGAAFGYPRYHFAMLPLWCALIVLLARPLLAESGLVRGAVVVLAALAGVYHYFVVGDPLLAANFDLKLAMMGEDALGPRSLAGVGKTLALAAAPVLLAAALALFHRGKPMFAALCLPLAIGGNLALDVGQARADYQTHLSYGERGTAEMLEHVRARLAPGERVVGGKDIVYHTVDAGYMEDWRWEDPGFVLERLARAETAFLVLGLHHNTMEQFRLVRGDARFQERLGRDYRATRIGSYFIWERAAERRSSQAAPAQASHP